MQRVLVVDDDPIIRDVLTEALSDEGYEVVAACDGQEALERTSDWRPHLILLDLMMPRLDGWEFRKRQLGLDGLRDVPVIVLTAARGLEQHAEVLRPAGTMAKPFNLGLLLQLVQRVLGEAV